MSQWFTQSYWNNLFIDRHGVHSAGEQNLDPCCISNHTSRAQEMTMKISM